MGNNEEHWKILCQGCIANGERTETTGEMMYMNNLQYLHVLKKAGYNLQGMISAEKFIELYEYENEIEIYQHEKVKEKK